eukprot:CAMPEP_0203926580 /NCGR_PEP_ID=MMETSP0359-20131031/66103_1 /ASSEMBLY_ACC=CAM_ASM_000338 /TAXON_ID=268821 /ORGANISM="Scrippsiella Hangoei, Strain SHTV-5" /LENGTH=481 /DNA_ID=CAMNT_0050855213 /DNA_START=1 /DNA_END=1446 /DNA_ORIENTATION=+
MAAQLPCFVSEIAPRGFIRGWRLCVLLLLVCIWDFGGGVAAAAEPVEEELDADEEQYASPAPPASDDPIPDKVGVEIHMSKKERSSLKALDCSMCKAILTEMHIEVNKHGMTSKGWGSESQVWETSNAICLALLQKYKLNLTAPALDRKAEGEDDEYGMMGGAGGADVMRGMLVLKMGCQRWVEDYGGDMSGYIYRVVKDKSNTAEGAAQDFCVRHVNLCGKGRKEKQQKAREKEKGRQKVREAMVKKQEQEEAKQKEKDPFAALPEDSKFGLQRMLEMARDDPLHYMEDDAKERVRKARLELRCDVCRTVFEDVYSQVSSKPRALQREYDILPFMEGACEGGKDLSVPSYFGVEPPPLPPAWTDAVRPQLQKTPNAYALRPFGKKAAKKRSKWRKGTAEGNGKPPPAGESEGDMMMTLTCKDMLEPARMAEALYGQIAACGASGPACKAGLLAAADVCKAADGSACRFGGDEGSVSKAEL